MVIITDVERILPMDTSLNQLNQRVDLVFGETSRESDFCKFKFGATPEWLPYIWLGLLELLLCLIYFERNKVRGSLCIRSVSNTPAEWSLEGAVAVLSSRTSGSRSDLAMHEKSQRQMTLTYTSIVLPRLKNDPGAWMTRTTKCCSR